MKFITLIFTLLLSTQAFAHHDHLVGDSTMHILSHAALWAVCGYIGYKVVTYFKNKKNKESDH